MYAAEAAKHDHVDVLRWLNVHYPENADQHLADAIMHAAYGGHLAVVTWLYKNVAPSRGAITVKRLKFYSVLSVQL